MIQPTLINLHPNEYSQGFYYFALAVKLVTCNENVKVDANVNVDLIEKKLIQVNGGIMINVDVNVKNVMYVKKIMLGFSYM